MAAEEFIAVLVTVGSAIEAERIAESLVEERLAACVNIVGPIRSIYRWQGVIERGEEQLLVVKTRRALFEALSTRVHELHSYSMPEVLAFSIDSGAAAYLAWIAESTALA